MSTINVGTTNLDGTGSATNLTTDNATAYLLGSGIESVDGVSIGTAVFPSGYTVSYASVDVWNKDGFKEVQIDNDADLVIVDNFVDVDIDNTNDSGSTILVNNAKRGSIDTADGDDSITVSVYSNKASWSNAFTINANGGNDSITLENALNSQYTSYVIDAGEGDDSVDVSDLLDAYSSSVTRTIDGGDGFDTLVVSNVDVVDFEGFEVVSITDDSELEVTESLLSSNYTEEGLVISGGDLTFDSLDYTVSALSDGQIDYLTDLGLDAADYSAVVVNSGSDQYTVFTNDDSYVVA